MLIPLCHFEGHFWPKKKHLFYVGWGRGGDYQRYRLRFCPSHALDVDEYLSQFKIDPDGPAAGTNWRDLSKCLSCRKPTDELSWQVFVTGYPTQDQREDYWGYLHVGCQLPTFLLDTYTNPESAS